MLTTECFDRSVEWGLSIFRRFTPLGCPFCPIFDLVALAYRPVLGYLARMGATANRIAGWLPPLVRLMPTREVDGLNTTCTPLPPQTRPRVAG